MNTVDDTPSNVSLASTVALIYAAFGTVWILLSDTVLGWVLQDRDLLLLVSTIKGWVFVFLSALLIFFVAVRFPRGDTRSGSARLWHVQTPWAALGVITLAIVAVIAASVVQMWRQEHAQLTRIMQTSAIGISERLADWHLERLSTAQQVQGRQQVAELWRAYVNAPSPVQLALIGQALEIYLTSPDVSGVELLNHQLDRVWASGPGVPERHPPAIVTTFKEALTRGTAMATHPWRDGQGRVHLAYIGLLDPASPTAGLVVMHLDASAHFQHVLHQWHALESAGQAQWVTGNGDTEMPWVQSPPMAWPIPPTRRIELKRPVTDTDWLVVLEVDTQVLWATVLRRGGLFALAGMLGIFSAFAVAYLVLQRRTLATRERALADVRRSREDLSRSESRYRLLAENSRDAVWLYDIASQRLDYISPAIEGVVGYTPDEMRSMTLKALLLPASVSRALNWLTVHVQRFNAGDPTAAEDVLELLHRHKNGQVVTVEVSMKLVANAQGQAVQVQGVSRDITQRRQSERQIRMLSQATEQSPVSVIITDATGIIEYVNPAFERMSGYQADEVMGRNPRLLQSTRTPPDTYRQMWETLGRGESWLGELINRRKSGTDYLQSVTIAPLRNEQHEVVQYVSVQMDITAQRAAEERLERLAWFDPLTGLPNRQRLLGELQSCLSSLGQAANQPVAGLIIMNVDRFKAINDALGRATGDRVLQAVAERLRPVVRQGDFLAHLNGDEFGLLVRHLSSDTEDVATRLSQWAATLQAQMDDPLRLERDTLAVTLSMGMTVLTGDDGDNPVEALRRADTALHRAKESGGHQSALFDTDMGQLATERFGLEQDLRRGLEAGELRLYVQPQVDGQGHMVSAEALVRWAHPHKGLVSPALFVPIAEQSGLIEPIGQWVLRQVCGWLARLRRSGRPLSIAVNISPRQFHQFDFTQRVLEILDSTGAHPGDLVIEITEGVVMREVDTVIHRMIELTRHGIRFSIDDFGTGYSSLSYLKSLPIHEIKIDRSFVQDAPKNPSDAALVEAILSVAQHMHLQVVAEGVETEGHAAFFKSRARVLMQGYLYGRPEPVESVLDRWMSAAR